MTWDELRTYCLSLPDAVETFPFEPTVSVFKAPGGKMFAITTSPTDPVDVSVKCDPDIGEALRTEYESIVPGYHLNKRHWITVTVGGDVPDDRVRELVLDSYELVARRVGSKSSASHARAATRGLKSS
jgi:predicted DNA-binding protein (MmcQ/YjbR family)